MRAPKLAGFTLIELLVVIAIIGLLASVVLASLSTARDRGRDAAVQSNLHAVAVQAEIMRGSKNCYPGPSGVCATPGAGQVLNVLTTGCTSNTNFFCNQPTILAALSATQKATNGGLISVQFPSGTTSWVVLAQLATDKALAWCVDSSGKSKREGTPAGAALTNATLNALATNYVCN